jgi:TPR repeat protein
MNAFGRGPFQRPERRTSSRAARLTVCAIALCSFPPALAAADAGQAVPPPVPFYSDHVSKSLAVGPGMMVITTQDSFETVVTWYRANLKDQMAEVAMGPAHTHYLTHNGAGVDIAAEGSGGNAGTKISLFWKTGRGATPITPPVEASSAPPKDKQAQMPPPKSDAALAQLASAPPLHLAGVERLSLPLADLAPGPKIDELDLAAPVEPASVPPLGLAGIEQFATRPLAGLEPAPRIEELDVPEELASVPPPSLVGVEELPVQALADFAPAPAFEELAVPAPVKLEMAPPLRLVRVEKLPVQPLSGLASAPKIKELNVPVELASLPPPSLVGVEELPVQPLAGLAPALTIEDLDVPVELAVVPPLSLAEMEQVPAQPLVDLAPALMIEELDVPVELAVVPSLSPIGVEQPPVQPLAGLASAAKIEELDIPAPVELVSIPPLSIIGVEQSRVRQVASLAPVAIEPPKPPEPQAAEERGDGSGESQGAGYFKQGRYAEALIAWENAAARGSKGAALALGMMYDSGQGAPQSYADAFSWYQLAAERDDPIALFNVGAMYEAGRGVRRSSAEAAGWYERAVVRGSAQAAYNLARLYERGDGVSRDVRMATLYLKHAEELGVMPVQGHRRGRRAYVRDVAFNTIHDIVEPGREDRPDDAAPQIESRAADGDAFAQYDLAYYLEKGIGREIDLYGAYRMYSKAAEQARDERLRRIAGAGAAEVSAHMAATGRRRGRHR